MANSTRITACLFFFALACAYVFLSQAEHGPTTASASPSYAQTNLVATLPQVSANSADLAECGDWTRVSSANIGIFGNSLSDVGAISGNDLWAVGSYDTGERTQTLVEHWDGSAWTVIPSPNVSTRLDQLVAVDAVSMNDVWAVGDYLVGDNGFLHHSLIEHWNGSSWNIVQSPVVVPGNTLLTDISAVSSNDIWAVGHYDDNVALRTLIEHWDGTTWSVVASPNGHALNKLEGVSAVSTNDVWAVGNYYDGVTYLPLTMHWDGTSWNIVPAPYLVNSFLHEVEAISSNDVWAVGEYVFKGHSLTLTEHWNGTAWSVITSPNIDLTCNNSLVGIDAISSSDIWAVGSCINDQIIQHWDGNAWSMVPTPNIVAAWPFPVGVAALSSSDVWAIGTDGSLPNTTLAEHYVPVVCPPPPRCPDERFTDVCSTDYFYTHVLDLNDLSIVSGYNTIPPCETPAHVSCFKPYNWTTRGQVAKIISLAAGFNEPVGGISFEDVPVNHTFYQYIKRMANREIIIGYPCGGPDEPCVPPGNRPYFRPGVTVNRAQLAKMTALTFGFQDPTSGQTFEDVVPDNHFYPFIENLASRQIINGYSCGGAGEPCIPPMNRPYFRYGDPITRGQVGKIVNLARTQPSPTPVNTLTPLPTDTPIFTATPASTATTTPASTTTPTTEPQSPTPTSTLAVGKGEK